MTIVKSGREAPLASLSARQAKAMGLLTSGTSGQHGSTLSRMASDVMCLSLANRLQRKQGGLGSILYRVTWKHWITDAGRLIPAQRALAHRSSGKDCTGWPRPLAADSRGSAGRAAHKISEMPNAVKLAGWPRPTVGNATGGQTPPPGTTAEGRTPDGRKVTVALPYLAQLTGWPRPKASDARGMPYEPDGSGRVEMRQTVGLTGWPRPQAGSPATDSYNAAGNTDSSRKTKAIAETVEYRFTPSTFGEMPTGSCAVTQTERVSGPLNPLHSLWLMVGPFATAYMQCAERVTLSTSARRRASSKR